MQNLSGISNQDFEKHFMQPLRVKKRKYENKKGLTEPQRQLLHAITSKKGNFLREIKRANGRTMFRCYDKEVKMIMPSPDFHKVIVQNLVSKGFLVKKADKYVLK